MSQKSKAVKKQSHKFIRYAKGDSLLIKENCSRFDVLDRIDEN